MTSTTKLVFSQLLCTGPPDDDAEAARRVDRWLEADLEKFEAFLAKEVVPGAFARISQKSFVKSFCKSHFPHRSVSFSFIMNHTENGLTDF